MESQQFIRSKAEDFMVFFCIERDGEVWTPESGQFSSVGAAFQAAIIRQWINGKMRDKRNPFTLTFIS